MSRPQSGVSAYKRNYGRSTKLRTPARFELVRALWIGMKYELTLETLTVDTGETLTTQPGKSAGTPSRLRVKPNLHDLAGSEFPYDPGINLPNMSGFPMRQTDWRDSAYLSENAGSSFNLTGSERSIGMAG